MQRKGAQLLGFVVAALLALPAHAQEHRAINAGTAHGLPFSDAILAGNTLYIAGQAGDDESGRLAPGGIAAETRVTLANLKKVATAAGFEMRDIVSVTVYLADFKDFAAMNDVYKAVMPDPKPARTTIQVAGMLNNARIEISAVAVKGR